MAELSAAAQVAQEIDARRSFLVEAGAGSGKTHTLIQALQYLLGNRRSKLAWEGRKIACITYTNVAKEQIIERIADDPLVYVGTIHEFLWSAIEGFQKQLREEIPDYNNSLRKPEDLTDWPADIQIVYSDRGRRLRDGRISHDDVLELAYRLVSRRPKLARIIADRYPVIFVDEYQDTAPLTIRLLLDHLAAVRPDRCVIGLFGDSMQQIYRHGVGVVLDSKLTRITKHENYRSAKPIVDVLNKIRPELPQQAVGGRQEGEVHLFLNAGHPPGSARLESARATLAALSWPHEDIKYLMLTHRGIADTLDYPSLLKIYRERGPYGRDDLMEGTELFVKYILQIEALCGSYEAKNYAELSQLLGLGSRPIIRHSQKAEIAQSLHDILVMRKTGKIGEVLDAVHGSGLLSKPREIREIERSIGSSNLDGRSQRDTEFAQKLRDISYQEVIAYMHFKNERTPFSTQHGVKGDEFDNVVVVIDDGVWNQYNMGKMLAGSDIESRRQRSRNLFYVCCSRARQRLAVVFLTDLPPEAKPVARDWFASGIVHP